MPYEYFKKNRFKEPSDELKEFTRKNFKKRKKSIYDEVI